MYTIKQSREDHLNWWDAEKVFHTKVLSNYVFETPEFVLFISKEEGFYGRNSQAKGLKRFSYYVRKHSKNETNTIFQTANYTLEDLGGYALKDARVLFKQEVEKFQKG